MGTAKGSTGFTLIECLVATVILGVGVVGVAGMFAAASVSEKKAAYVAQATQIAEQTLDGVRSGIYDISEQPSGSVTIATPGLPHARGVLAWQPYVTGTGPTLTLVALDLSWQWASSSSGKYSVSTLVADKGGA